MVSRRVYECDRCFKDVGKHKNLTKIKIGNRKPIEFCKKCLNDVDATIKPDKKENGGEE